MLKENVNPWNTLKQRREACWSEPTRSPCDLNGRIYHELEREAKCSRPRTLLAAQGSTSDSKEQQFRNVLAQPHTEIKERVSPLSTASFPFEKASSNADINRQGTAFKPLVGFYLLVVLEQQEIHVLLQLPLVHAQISCDKCDARFPGDTSVEPASRECVSAAISVRPAVPFDVSNAFLSNNQPETVTLRSVHAVVPRVYPKTSANLALFTPI